MTALLEFCFLDLCVDNACSLQDKADDGDFFFPSTHPNSILVLSLCFHSPTAGHMNEKCPHRSSYLPCLDLIGKNKGMHGSFHLITM